MLGIFQGKKEEFNSLILKALIFGPKTTKQLAEYIYLNRKAAIPPIKLNDNRVKTLVSQISRKGSRIEELETKQYTYQKERLWYLTPKGLGVGLTLFSSVTDIFPQVKSWLGSISEETKREILQNPMLQILDRNIQRKALARASRLIESLEFMQFLRDTTAETMKQGTDLDKTILKEFLSLIAGRFLVNRFPALIMSELRKRGAKL